jgi:hypothetical protein
MKSTLKIFLFSVSTILLLWQAYRYVAKGFPSKIFTSNNSFFYKLGYFISYDLYLILGIILLIIAIKTKPKKTV